MRLARATLACLFLGVAPLLAQSPQSKPTTKPAPTKKPAPKPPKEKLEQEKLRKLNGSLIQRLIQHDATLPRQELLRLRIEVLREGHPIDRGRRIDVSWRYTEKVISLRIRFLDPPALRGSSYLLEETISPAGEASVRAWRYDPRRRRSLRSPSLTWRDRIGDTGLRYSDLCEQPASQESWTFVGWRRLKRAWGKQDRQPPGPEVLVVRTASAKEPPERARRLHVDPEQMVVLLSEELDASGKNSRLVWSGKHRRVGKSLRPFASRIAEPEEKRLTLITVESARSKVPPAHFESTRYWLD